MKKVIVILLAAALLLSVVGCKKAENKKLTVAMSPDFAPMEFVDTSKTGQEQYVGFDVTLANFLADELGMELEIKPMSFDACMTAVQLGSVDMAISGFSWKPDRAENFLLSDYYIAGDNETQQSVITVKAKENTCKTQADFSGWKVGAQASSLQRASTTPCWPCRPGRSTPWPWPTATARPSSPTTPTWRSRASTSTWIPNTRTT